ncbi:MAG: RHS repeat-associated core domain-containing protein [Dehalococcoidia bacterium]
MFRPHRSTISAIHRSRRVAAQTAERRSSDPATGRFISRDPMASLPGWGDNPFGYAGANPVNFTDPSGLCPASPAFPNGAPYCYTAGVASDGVVVPAGGALASAASDATASAAGCLDPVGILDVGGRPGRNLCGAPIGRGGGGSTGGGSGGGSGGGNANASPGRGGGARPGPVTYTASTFASNLAVIKGPRPAGAQAHHVLPRAFEPFFRPANINIHDPAWGAWVPRGLHLGQAWAYNQSWAKFISRNPARTESEILAFARKTMLEVYGVDFR